MVDLFVEDCIRTHSGIYLNLIEPDPKDIHIEDIAHGLSLVNRFVGQSNYPISVAQHSLSAYDLASSELKFEALMHDATEAYICDIPTPLKRHLPNYKRIEANLYKVIADKYGFPDTISKCVKKIDRFLLVEEYQKYCLEKLPTRNNPKYQEEMFLKAFYESR